MVRVPLRTEGVGKGGGGGAVGGDGEGGAPKGRPLQGIHTQGTLRQGGHCHKSGGGPGGLLEGHVDPKGGGGEAVEGEGGYHQGAAAGVRHARRSQRGDGGGPREGHPPGRRAFRMRHQHQLLLGVVLGGRARK